MFPIRVKTVQESDLRMLGSLARNIQRVLPVTQADIDAAAALGKGWVVWKVFEVSDPLDNLRGGTQLIIRQNSIQPGQNVRRVIFVSGPGGQTVIIRGADYIVLPDAIANSLSYVKAFGGAEQRNVPEGYVENQFVYMMDDSYLLTNIIPEYGYRIEMDMQTTTTKATPVTYLGASVGSDGIRFAHVSNKKCRVIAFGDTTDSEGTISNNARIKYILTPERVTIYEDGVQELDYAYTATSTGTSIPLAINAYNYNDGIAAPGEEGIYLYSLKIWNTQGELVMDLVPATKLNPLTVGFYDKVSGQHLTATAGTFAAGPAVQGPTPDAPIEIVGNNGAIRFSPNLLDMAQENIVVGKYINNNGAEVDSTSNFYNSKFIPVSPSSIYSWSTSESIRYINFMEYDSNQVFLQRTLIGSSGNPAGTSGTFITRNDTAYVLVGSNPLGAQISLDDILAINWQFEKGSSVSQFVPFGTVYDAGPIETIRAHGDNLFDGGTATAQRLLKLGDYADEQEILSGIVTRKIGLKIFDGTESWTRANSSDASGNRVFYITLSGREVANNVPMLCTHFKYIGSAAYATLSTGEFLTNASTTTVYFDGGSSTTVVSWRNKVKSLYEAGTPIIMIYPLATPITESVAGQALQVTDGDNVLEITQASLTGLELEAQYNAAVSLTIQEVEDANLDNNVTVTIQ